MIHLQQEGTPVHDIVAGLCYAILRILGAILGRERNFQNLLSSRVVLRQMLV